jgi:hypothetical protein
MYPTQRPAKVLAARAVLGCNAQSSTQESIQTMRLKRRYLPDFETSSLLLFVLLAAGTAQTARAQFSVGPARSTPAATATTATSAITTKSSAASSAARAAAGELSTRKDGSARPVPKPSKAP